MVRRRAILVCAIASIGGPALAAERPSFDCAKATTPAERAICASDRLARLDRAMTSAYRQLKANLTGDGLIDEQTAFLAQRDACGSNVTCLAARMEDRRAALALERKKGKDSRAAFVGRYRARFGWMIVRRTLAGDYELSGQTADPRARWACDVSGRLLSVKDGAAMVEAGEDNDSRPLYLKLRGNALVVTEDPDRPLAGATCGHNGSVEGRYLRASRIR